MLHSVIIYLISLYYVEKALHLSDDTQIIKKGLLYSIAGFLTIYIAIWIYDLKTYKNLAVSSLCSTLIYVIPSALNCFISCAALGIGFFIRDRLEPHIQN